MSDLVRLFRVLASAPRLRVLRLLTRNSECTVGQLADRLSLSLPLVSKHLALLRTNGVVATRREGRRVFCRLTEPEGEAFTDTLLKWLAPLLRRGPDTTLEQV
ncbi:MAG: transcriptional regulator [Armatimonadetes bacterium CG_4_10_14_0_8_um_filter_66_14]|nr:helix-turn-helix transcriptional regulator [Armatimonadota bacterium]PIZ44669.1 MAG: transcriptional regulator [Armatimonadetes bacterium CG_4_10_14_0_8_um_filter_66_14]PJB68852.1 MAG: transcriptional regulator [Armatimonadetes bacterium CG_4_9_14_3_um_filter_66_14]